MPLLYFWRGDNYRRDLDLGAGYHLNQANALLHTIDIGDSLWAFTRRSDGPYVLAAELVISSKTRNPSGFRYGAYRIWGDLRRSRYFAAGSQRDITSLVRSLSPSTRGDVLGRAFQGHAAVRQLTVADHQVLTAYAATLQLEPRARLVPEERLEALLHAGDADAVAQLLRAEPSGLAQERQRYLSTQAPARDRALAEELRHLYSGQCQLCTWAPRDRYSLDLCEAHHARWLSRGGADVLSNMVLTCPNHHRAIHRCDAQFDYLAHAFLFATSSETLVLSRHELAP